MVWELMRLAERKQVKISSAASLKTQLSRWENGHVTPDYYQALLCELFQAAPGELGFGIQDLSPGLLEKAVLGPRWSQSENGPETT